MVKRTMTQRAVRFGVGGGLALWLLATIVQVMLAILPVMRGQFSGIRMFGADTADGMVGIPGLTYSGAAGIALAVAEMIIVLSAMIFGARRAIGPRRLSLLVMLAWCLLWAIGCLRQEGLAGWNHPAPTSLAVVGAVLAVSWLTLRWRR